MRHLTLLTILLAASFPSGSAAAQSGRLPDVRHAHTTYGYQTGEKGFVASTAPQLGEYFLTGYSGGSVWFAVEYDHDLGGFIQTYSSETYDSDSVAVAITVADLHPRAGDEIVFVREDGEVHLIQQRTKEEIAMLDLGIIRLDDFDALDIDGDGLDEMVVLADNGLHLLESDGTTIFHHPQMTGEEFVVGQMDADTNLEVATPNGWVLDMTTHLVQCTVPITFGRYVSAADFDSDGMQELVIRDNFDDIHTYDVDTCSLIWSLPFDQVDTVHVGDSNGDGVEDLTIGEDSWGRIYGFDLATQTELWSIDKEYNGTSFGVLMDVDGDSIEEVVWSASSTHEHRLTIGDVATESVTWESADLEGPFAPLVLGDIDGDQVAEVLSLSAETNGETWSGGTIVALKQDSFLPIYSEPISQYASSIVGSLTLHDVDGDGDMEVLVTRGAHWSALDYDAVNGFITIHESQDSPANGGSFRDIEVADIDGDGTLEVLVGTTHPPSVAAYDYVTGLVEWHSVQMGPERADAVTRVLVADLEGDGNNEIIGMTDEGDAYIYTDDYQIRAVHFGEFTSMEAQEPRPNGAVDLVLGDKSGGLSVARWLAGTLHTVAYRDLTDEPIIGFRLVDDHRVMLGADRSMRLHALDTGEVLWEALQTFGDFGRSMVILDNGDWAASAFTGLFKYGVR